MSLLMQDERYYLRSLGNDPRKVCTAEICFYNIIITLQDIASFPLQYPELANDIKLPLMFGEEKLFSSVLRISSSDARLWTHYDVILNLTMHHVIK